MINNVSNSNCVGTTGENVTNDMGAAINEHATNVANTGCLNKMLTPFDR